MADETLNENGRLVCLIAAQIIAGERANVAITNPGNVYNTADVQRLFNLANQIVQQAMQFAELRQRN